MNDENQQNEFAIAEDEVLKELSMTDLPDHLQEAMKRAGWTSLMPVQAKSLPYLLDQRDLMVQSRTGSGKTGAFLLPILNHIDPDNPNCQALILAPTRELASQVAQQAEVLTKGSPINSVAVYGGVGYAKQVKAFRDGAHIVVGTPGRILDHLLRGSLNIDELDTLVFDEADRMLSIGFYPDMKALQGHLPNKHIHTLMFSATYPPQILRLSNEFMHDPRMLSLSSKSVHIAEIEHCYYVVPGMGRERNLIRIIEEVNPTSAIIFCNTKANVHYVTEVLKNFGYDADELSADLSQSKRERVLNRVRKGDLRYLVATDVAARGIDIPDLTHVFMYESPEDPESYVHRAGRTARAGAGGTVISIVDVIQKLELDRLARRYEIDMVERKLPDDDDVAKAVSDRVVASLEARRRTMKPLQYERMHRFKALAQALAESEGELDLVAMLLDEFYQGTLSHPPVVPKETTPVRGKSSGGRNRRPKSRSQRSKPEGGRHREDGQQREEGDRKPRNRRRRPRRKPSGGGESQG